MAAMFSSEKLNACSAMEMGCPSVRLIPEVDAAVLLVVAVLVCLRVLPCIL